MSDRTLVASWTPYDWRRINEERVSPTAGSSEAEVSDWREAMRSKVKEETSLRLPHTESPSWRSRLDAVKAQSAPMRIEPWTGRPAPRCYSRVSLLLTRLVCLVCSGG